MFRSLFSLVSLSCFSSAKRAYNIFQYNMEIVSGKQKGTFIYIHDGYTYNIDKRIKNRYRCSRRRATGCSGVAKIIDGQVHVQTLHQHPPDTKKLEKSKMQKEMLRLSRESLLPLKEIFDNVSRTNLEVATHISFNSMKSIMARERAKQRPPIPCTFQALCTVLTKYEWIKEFYKGSVVAQDGSMAAIFSNDVLINALKTATEIFVDGTFSVVPRNPYMIQLYTVHIRYKNTGIAVFFILCEKRTFALYQAIWEKIIEIVPDIKNNVKFIMGDYERATNKVLHKCFPEASLKGCWFHYNQAVLRKWRQLGLKNAPRRLIMMVMSIPLIPASLFEQSFTILQYIADTISGDYPMILQFMSYLRKTWLPAANKVSVYGCPVRTNNIVESFHNTISKKFGSRHPNVWIFIEKLKKVIIDQEIDLRRLQNNLQARRPQTRANRERNNIILQKQKDLVENRLPLIEFLESFSHFYETYLYNLDMIDEEIITNENDDFEICTDFLSESCNSTSEEPLKTANNNINANISGDLLTLVQRQDSVKNEQLFLSTLRNKYPDTQDEQFTSENATDTDVTINNTVNFTSVNPIITMEDIQNTSNISNLPQSNNEFDEEHIYNIPEDDFGYWYEDQESTLESDHVPYHKVEGHFLETCEENRETIRSDRTCTACIDAEANQIFIPCGHICCCEECANYIMRENDNVKKCPICKEKISTVHKVYIP